MCAADVLRRCRIRMRRRLHGISVMVYGLLRAVQRLHSTFHMHLRCDCSEVCRRCVH